MSSDTQVLRLVNQGHPITTEVFLGADLLPGVFTVDFTSTPEGGRFVTALVRMAAQVDVYATYDVQYARGEWALLQDLFPQIGEVPRSEIPDPRIHIKTQGGERLHPTMLTQLLTPDHQGFRWVVVDQCHASRKTVHAQLRYPEFSRRDAPIELVGQYADELRLLIQGMVYPL
jgi:hypothetical protein